MLLQPSPSIFSPEPTRYRLPQPTMSSTEPDNANTDGEHGADITNLPVSGPPTVEDFKDQLDAQISEKSQQNLVFVAEGAKIEQDYQAALTNSADPSTLRQHEEAKQAHEALHSQFLREFIELRPQRLDMEKEDLANSKEENQRLRAEQQRLEAERDEQRAKLEEAEKKKEERARVEKEKKWWRSLTAVERKREKSVLHQKLAVLEK